MNDAHDAAREFAEIFPTIYLRFHRRDEKKSELSGASRAVLTHLSLSGPLTVGEAAKHLGRAQSVVSEILDQLASKNLIERIRDSRDRRRALVWLTPEGVEFLERDRDVLSRELLERAMQKMTRDARHALVLGARALVDAIDRAPIHAHEETKKRRSKHHE